MATEKKNGGNQERRGFAAISSLVSDVDELGAPATGGNERADDSTSPNDVATDTRTSQPGEASQSEQTPPTISSSIGKWIAGVAAVAAVIWLVNQNPPSTSPPPAVPNASPSNGELQMPTTAPDTALPVLTPAEQKPPVGTQNILTLAQIRYCLSEDIRVDAAKGVVDTAVESEVDRFNSMVDDYNRRCGSFRYRPGILARARTEVEALRSRLQAEGAARFLGQRPTRQSQSAADPGAAVRVRNPFDKKEVFQFPPGTPEQEAKERVKQILLQRSRERPLSDAPAKRQHVDLNPPRAPAGSSLVNRATSPVHFGATSAVADLSAPERESLEAACSSDKYMNGRAAYQRCVSRQLAALVEGPRHPDLSSLTIPERQSIEAACSADKYMNGPAAYNSCLRDQLADLRGESGRPNLSALSEPERQSIESACSADKYTNGPAAYNRCLRNHLNSLGGASGRPSLSLLNEAERQSIESACSADKYMNGPAAYNQCLSRHLSAAEAQPRPDLSFLTSVDRRSLDTACSTDKYLNGPAAYNACLIRELSSLRR